MHSSLLPSSASLYNFIT